MERKKRIGDFWSLLKMVTWLSADVTFGRNGRPIDNILWVAQSELAIFKLTCQVNILTNCQIVISENNVYINGCLSRSFNFKSCHIQHCFVDQMSWLLVHLANCFLGKLFSRQIVFSSNCFLGKLFSWQTVFSANCPPPKPKQKIWGVGQFVAEL